MKKIKIHLLTIFCLIFTIGILNGCDDDYWEDHDDFYPIPDNYYIYGEWYISDIEGKYCSYNIDEEFFFYENGDFETLGFDHLNEFGRWRRMAYDEIEVRFDGQNRRLQMHIEERDRHYMVLYVHDTARDAGYENKIRYRLFLKKVAGPRAARLKLPLGLQDSTSVKP